MLFAANVVVIERHDGFVHFCLFAGKDSICRRVRVERKNEKSLMDTSISVATINFSKFLWLEI